MTNPDDPAYPNDQQGTYPGLTKREDFAKAAMIGFLANRDYSDETPQVIGHLAVEQADAAIAELNKEAK